MISVLIFFPTINKKFIGHEYSLVKIDGRKLWRINYEGYKKSSLNPLMADSITHIHFLSKKHSKPFLIKKKFGMLIQFKKADYKIALERFSND